MKKRSIARPISTHRVCECTITLAASQWKACVHRSDFCLSVCLSCSDGSTDAASARFIPIIRMHLLAVCAVEFA